MSLRKIIAAVAVLSVAACSGGDSVPNYTGSKVKKPKEAAVRSELEYLQARLTNGNIKVHGLAAMEIVDIDHNRGEPVAVATMRHNENTPEIQLIMRMTEEGWQVYDRDLEDRTSSTYLVLRGGR